MRTDRFNLINIIGLFVLQNARLKLRVGPNTDLATQLLQLATTLISFEKLFIRQKSVNCRRIKCLLIQLLDLYMATFFGSQLGYLRANAEYKLQFNEYLIR